MTIVICCICLIVNGYGKYELYLLQLPLWDKHVFAADWTCY